MKGADKLQGGAKREHGSDRDEEDVGGPKECPSASTHIVQCQLRGHLILNRPRTTEGKGSLTQTGQEYLNFVTLNISLILVISYWYMVFYYFSFIYKSIHVHISYILARFHQTELLTDKINKLFFFFFDVWRRQDYKLQILKGRFIIGSSFSHGQFQTFSFSSSFNWKISQNIYFHQEIEKIRKIKLDLRINSKFF